MRYTNSYYITYLHRVNTGRVTGARAPKTFGNIPYKLGVLAVRDHLTFRLFKDCQRHRKGKAWNFTVGVWTGIWGGAHKPVWRSVGFAPPPPPKN